MSLDDNKINCRLCEQVRIGWCTQCGPTVGYCADHINQHQCVKGSRPWQTRETRINRAEQLHTDTAPNRESSGGKDTGNTQETSPDEHEPPSEPQPPEPENEPSPP